MCDDKKTVMFNLSKRSDRIPQYDFVRAFAIMSVVLCHSVESFFYMYQNRSILWGMLSTRLRIFDLIGITIGRLGVPLFLFLTGALMLHKEMESGEDCICFYKKSYIPLLVTMWIWIVLWNLFLVGYRTLGGETAPVTVLGVLENLLFLRNVNTIMPAWYIPMILGVYVFLPFLMIIVKKCSLAAMSLPLTLAAIVFLALPTVNLFLYALGRSAVASPLLDLGFSGGVWFIRFAGLLD